MASLLHRCCNRETLHWSTLELLVMRAGLAALLVFSVIIWNLPRDYAAMGHPAKDTRNGIARIVPPSWISWLADAAYSRSDPASTEPAAGTANAPASGAPGQGRLFWLKVVVGISLGLWVCGVAPVFTLLPALLTAIGTGAVRNSQGDITHHTQLAVMVTLAIWISHLVGAIRTRGWLTLSPGSARRMALWAIAVIAASYVASGIVKLKASDFRWIERVPAIGVQMVKSNLSDYYSSLEKSPQFEFNTVTAPRFILDHPNVARAFFGTGLVLELLAFALLWNRRICRWYAVGLLLMHFGISFFMDIEFRNHSWLLLIFCVSLPGFLRSRRGPDVPVGQPGDSVPVAAGGPGA